MLKLVNVLYNTRDKISYIFNDYGIYNIISDDTQNIINIYKSILGINKKGYCYSNNQVKAFYGLNLIPNITVKENILLYDVIKKEEIPAEFKKILETKLQDISILDKVKLIIFLSKVLDKNIILLIDEHNDFDVTVFNLLEKNKNDFLFLIGTSNSYNYKCDELNLNNYIKISTKENGIESQYHREKLNKKAIKNLNKSLKSSILLKVIMIILIALLTASTSFFCQLRTYQYDDILYKGVNNSENFAILNTQDDINVGLKRVNSDFNISNLFSVGNMPEVLNPLFKDTKYATSYIFNEDMADFEIVITDYTFYYLRDLGLINFREIDECVDKKITLYIYDGLNLNNHEIYSTYDFLIKDIIITPFTKFYLNNIDYDYDLYSDLFYIKGNKNTYFYLREKIKQVAFSINVNAKYEGVIVDLENTYNLEKNEVVMSKTFRDNYFKGYDIDDEIELIFKYTNAIIPEYTYKTKVIIKEIIENNNNLTNAYISNDLATIIRNTDYLLNFNYFDSFYLNGKEIKDNWELFYSYYDADKAYIIGDLEKEVTTFFTTINSDINVLIITMISIIVILIFTVFIDNYYYLNKNKKELCYLYYNGINTNFSLIKLFIVSTISLVIGFILALLIDYLYIIILHKQINSFINIDIKWLCYLLSILIIIIGSYILLYILAYFISKKVKAR